MVNANAGLKLPSFRPSQIAHSGTIFPNRGFEVLRLGL